MQRKLTGFTLIEVIITVVIMAILIGLVFEIFVTIGRISVYVQLNRAVHGEMMYTVQTIQNMVDDQDTQLTGLDLSGTGGDSLTYGRKQSLELADDTYSYEIYKNCTDEANCFLELNWLELDPDFLGGAVDSGSVALTDPNITSVESFMVRTLPYGSVTDYEQIMHKGFWLFLDLRVPQYTPDDRWYNVVQQTQLFFTMRKYE